MKYAVIETGGKQFLVSSNDVIRVEKLSPEKDNPFIFDKVLLRVEGDEISIGDPYVKGATVHGTVVKHGRDEKKIIFRYHSKTRYRKKKGHRQPYTEVRIASV